MDAWPDVIILVVASKLDPKTHLAWETHCGDSRDMPNYDDLDAFLTSRIQILEALQRDINSSDVPDDRNASRGPRPKKYVSYYTQSREASPTSRIANSPSSQCILCSEHHLLHRHHTLIHPPSETARVGTTVQPTAPLTSGVSSNQAVTHLPATVLLATARVRITTSHERCAVVRALLDQGSTATLISENLAQLLRSPHRRCNLRVAGINGGESTARSTTSITLSPTDCEEPAYTVHAIILPTLTQYAPGRVNIPRLWDHTRTLRLSDLDPFNYDPIDLVIGADLYGRILREGTILGGSHQPTAQNTIFGWVLSGVVASHSEATSVASVNVTLLEDLDFQLRQFWEVEEVLSTNELTPSEQACDDHFQRTHYRNHQGRYVVRLPFTSDAHPHLGDSFTHAMHNFHRLELRLSRNVEQEHAYRSFMRKYEDLGHMSAVSSPRHDPSPAYYIPHHAV